MDAAVDAGLARISRGRASELQPYTMLQSEYRAAIPRAPSDAGLACTKAVCSYIHETYGRFPASVDTMHLICFMHAHHLDPDYYRRFFHSGALGSTHAEHMAMWHGEAGAR